MNTEKIHLRFWSAMAERYGRRWAEQYGPDTSPAWKELINRFTPEQVKAALGMLPKEAPDFPPTMPQFEAILSKAASRMKDDPENYIRGYWRAQIVYIVSQELGHTYASLEPYVVAHRDTLGESMRKLLDDMESMERRTGQRTPGMQETCMTRCREIGRAYPQLRRAG